MFLLKLFIRHLDYTEWIFIKTDDKPHRPIDIEKDDICDDYFNAAQRLINILPFKETKNAIIDWMEQGKINQTDIDMVSRFIKNPKDVVEIAKAMAKKEAQRDAKQRKSLKQLIEEGNQDQEEPIDTIDGFEINPISEKALKKREQKLEEELAASMDHFIRVAPGLTFTRKSCNLEEKQFLEQEYDGKCQVCGKVIVKYNGEHYFEAINIIKYNKLPEKLEKSSKYGWNSLSLCPTHAAEYNYCSKVISSIYDQVMELNVVPGSEEPLIINIELPKGKGRTIKYTPRHFLAMKEAFMIFKDEK